MKAVGRPGRDGQHTFRALLRDCHVAKWNKCSVAAKQRGDADKCGNDDAEVGFHLRVVVNIDLIEFDANEDVDLSFYILIFLIIQIMLRVALKTQVDV